MFKGGQNLKSMVMGAMLLLLLSACQVDPDNCLLAHNFVGEFKTNTVNVPSWSSGDVVDGVLEVENNGWIDSGIDVTASKTLKIKTTGTVNLCEGSGVANIKVITPDVKSSDWYNTGIYINRGQKYKLDVSGSYSRWPNGGSGLSCSGANTSGYWDENCQSKDGRGMFAYIGNPNNINNWSTLRPTPILANNTDYESSNPEFYELYNYPSGPSGYDFNVYSNNSGPDGYLYLRYADGNAGRGYDTNWSGDYSDNTGGYSVSITTYEECVGKNGEYLAAYVGGEAPEENVDPTSAGNILSLHSYAKASPPRRAGEFEGNANKSGRLWLKIIDDGDIDWDGDGKSRGDGDYEKFTGEVGSNSGSYSVTVTTYEPPPSGLSSLINSLVDPIREGLLGANGRSGMAEMLYTGVVNNFDFIAATRAAMALAIVFFAFSYMIGLSKITQKELFYLVLKLSIVIAVTSDGSWEFFYKHLFVFFIEGTDYLIWMVSSQVSDVVSGGDSWGGDGAISGSGVDQANYTFSFINQTVAMILSEGTWIRIGSLFNFFPLGFITGLLMVTAMFIFMFAVMKAVLVYVLAIIMTAMLLFLGPLCISFILFSKTKPIFDKWLRFLMSFALQPILLFTVLAIFNVFILSSFYNLLTFSVCEKCLSFVDLPFSEMVSLASLGLSDAAGNWDSFCINVGYLPWGIDSSQSLSDKIAKLPISLFSILIFIILCNAMLKFIDWLVNFAQSFLVGSSFVNLNAAAGETLNEAAKTATVSTKAAVGAAGYGLNKIDQISGLKSGNRISDKFKVAVRDRVGTGKVANVLSGGKILARSNESDGMGGSLKYSRSMMTTNEKRAADREAKFFSKQNEETQSAMRADRFRKQAQEALDKEGMSKSERNNYDRDKAREKGGYFKSKSANKDMKEQRDEAVARANARRGFNGRKDKGSSDGGSPKKPDGTKKR